MNQSAHLYAGRLATLFAALTLAACGGGGSADPAPDSAPPAPEPTGVAVIGLTDAPGDFLSYQVTVTGLAFERVNGAVIEVLPESATVDFAQYVDTTELLASASLPAGAYRSVSLALDYSDAQVYVEDAAGNAVAATVRDKDGAPLGRVDVELTFNDAERFVVNPGRSAHITLDFDLEASHKVELLDTPPGVVFDGVLNADTALEFPKTRRARGRLQSVNTDDATLTMTVRPFYHPRGDFGRVTLGLLDTTTYEIDGVATTGSDGLALLATLPADTPVLALAALNTATQQFEVSQLLAGSSVPWSESDIARGTVIARAGDTLTLRGATLIRKSMAVTFNDTLTVTVGPDTTLRQVDADLLPLGLEDISVGQAVTAHGELQADGSLLATAGLLRVRYTTLAGQVATVAPLSVDLSHLNGRRTALFDFAGTGVDAANDADPSLYEIDSTGLALSTLTIGAPIRAQGLVRPFGTAPEDFIARSVTDLGAVPARIRVGWNDGSNALLAADDSAISLALSAAALTRVHFLRRAGVFEDLLARGETLTLNAPNSGAGVYSLRIGGEQTAYRDFAGFSRALVAALDGTRSISRLRSTAMEDSATAFTARQILIALD